MTHFSESPSSVRVDRFRESGKWYDTYAIDMRQYYNLPSIHDAVARAWLDERWATGTGLESFFLVCLDPYHVHSHPVILREDYVQKLLKERYDQG